MASRAQGQRRLDCATDRGVCIEVVDIDAEYARLTAAGMRFNSPPISSPDDVDKAGLKVRVTYGRDPDGNSIELLETRPGGVLSNSALASSAS